MKINSFAFLSFAVAHVSGFQTIPTRSFYRRTTVRPQEISNADLSRHSNTILFSKEEDGVSKGMEDAFRQLADLNALGDDSFTVPEKKVQQDEAFAKAMQDLDLKGIKPSTPEAEAALYSDMASEISGASEFELIDDVKSEMGGSKTIFPKFDQSSRDTELFMEKALDEAIKEAQAKGDASVDKESLLDNKEIMTEIEAIFDRASEQLLEGLEDIRKEQVGIMLAVAISILFVAYDRLISFVPH
jgi:hypothetical protein